MLPAFLGDHFSAIGKGDGQQITAAAAAAVLSRRSFPFYFFYIAHARLSEWSNHWSD